MLYIKENWFKIREAVFLFLLGAEIILRLFDISNINMKTPIGMKLVSIELFWIPVCLGVLYAVDVLIVGIRKNIKKICIDAFIGVFFVIAAYTSLSFNILATGIFLVSSDKSSLKNIAKTIAISLFIGTGVVILLSQAGIIKDEIFYRGKNFGRDAHSLGFVHYAYPARQLLFGWCAYLFSKEKKCSWPELFIHFALIYAVYYFTTQRLTFFVFVFTLIMYIVIVKYELIKINSGFITFCAGIGFTVAAAGSILVTYFYDSSIGWMAALDKFINTRLKVGTRAFELYDVTLFGQYIPYFDGSGPEGYFCMDCGYLDVMMKQGLILFIIVIALYTVIHLFSCLKNDTKLFVWMMSVMVYLIIDGGLIDLASAGSAVIMFGAVFDELKKDTTSIKISSKSLSR